MPRVSRGRVPGAARRPRPEATRTARKPRLRTGVYSTPLIRALRLLPHLQTILPAEVLDAVDEERLVRSTAALLQRARPRHYSPDTGVRLVQHELSKMQFADPSSCMAVHAAALSISGWDHSRAIIHTIRSRLPHGTATSDSALAKAFRLSVRNLKRHCRGCGASPGQPQPPVESVHGCVQATVQRVALEFAAR
ncbi:hypothetical protein AB1Y20_007064 [Prymnesium parvum]|uniref:Uncharacterized protein n=1 Tax=Prymnesium parvum TaxID=97485 RepID=A0AB34IZD1_PRYPA